jgi:NADH-quinone oxidoreductase subunit E
MKQETITEIQKVREAPEKFDEEGLERIIGKYAGKLGGLIATLEEIQRHCGYLPEEALRMVAAKTGSSLVDVYAVATFYSYFSLKPRGKHLITVCLGTACHVRGAARVVDEFERQLGIGPGETSMDNEFTLETVNCLGACALGPVVVVDGRYHSKVGKLKVKELIEGAISGDRADIDIDDDRIFPLEVSCPRCNRSMMDGETQIDGYASVRVIVAGARGHGLLRLSSVYGSRATACEADISDGEETKMLCPHCHESLAVEQECVECGAAMAAMMIKGGGIALVCSRRGCGGHMLDLG